jgi:hypothetical protein
MLHKESSVDVPLKQIVDGWIARHASMTSAASTKLPESDAYNLDGPSRDNVSATSFGARVSPISTTVSKVWSTRTSGVP